MHCSTCGIREGQPRCGVYVPSRASSAWGGSSDTDHASQSRKLKGSLLSQGITTWPPVPPLSPPHTPTNHTPHTAPRPAPPVLFTPTPSAYTSATMVRKLEGGAPQVTQKQGAMEEVTDQGDSRHWMRIACSPRACLYSELPLVASWQWSGLPKI